MSAVMDACEQKLLTPEQAAELMQVSRSHIFRLLKDPTFPRVRISDRVQRIPEVELWTWVESRRES